MKCSCFCNPIKQASQKVDHHLLWEICHILMNHGIQIRLQNFLAPRLCLKGQNDFLWIAFLKLFFSLVATSGKASWSDPRNPVDRQILSSPYLAMTLHHRSKLCKKKTFKQPTKNKLSSINQPPTSEEPCHPLALKKDSDSRKKTKTKPSCQTKNKK